MNISLKWLIKDRFNYFLSLLPESLYFFLFWTVIFNIRDSGFPDEGIPWKMYVVYSLIFIVTEKIIYEIIYRRKEILETEFITALRCVLAAPLFTIFIIFGALLGSQPGSDMPFWVPFMIITFFLVVIPFLTSLIPQLHLLTRLAWLYWPESKRKSPEYRRLVYLMGLRDYPSQNVKKFYGTEPARSRNRMSSMFHMLTSLIFIGRAFRLIFSPVRYVRNAKRR